MHFLKKISFIALALFLVACANAPQSLKPAPVPIEYQGFPNDVLTNTDPKWMDIQYTLRDRGLYLDQNGKVKLIVTSPSGIEIISHRGDNNAPENSLSGIKQALLNGFDTVEIDVRRTQDGHWILHHDNKTGRATSFANGNRLTIQRINYEQWRKLKLRDMETGQLIDVIPPSLNSAIRVFSHYAKPHQRLNVELKSKGSLMEFGKIDHWLRQHLNPNQYYYSSINLDSLEKMRGINPSVYLGLIQKPDNQSIKVLRENYTKAVTTDPYYKAHKRGIEFVADLAETHYGSKNRQDWTSLKNLKVLRDLLGPNVGLHLDIRQYKRRPAMFVAAKSQGIQLQTYTINRPDYHIKSLQALSKSNALPDGIIVDGDIYDISQDLFGAPDIKRNYSPKTTMGQAIAKLPSDADFQNIAEQIDYLMEGLYLTRKGQLKHVQMISKMTQPKNTRPRLELPDTPSDDGLPLDNSGAIRIKLPIDDS